MIKVMSFKKWFKKQDLDNVCDLCGGEVNTCTFCDGEGCILCRKYDKCDHCNGTGKRYSTEKQWREAYKEQVNKDRAMWLAYTGYELNELIFKGATDAE